MQCAPAPSTECVFLGERSFRVPFIPGDDPQHRKTVIVHNMEVRFSCLKPQALVVKVRVREISEE
jgi:hypothetical protein